MTVVIQCDGKVSEEMHNIVSALSNSQYIDVSIFVILNIERIFEV
jgi:hypothetical protein